MKLRLVSILVVAFVGLILLLIMFLTKNVTLGDNCANVTGLGPGGAGWDANLEPAKDLCYFERATKEVRIEFCDNTGEMKNDCISAIAAITKNEKLCTGSLRDNCLYDIAETNKDTSFCQLISSTGFQASCIQNVVSLK